MLLSISHTYYNRVSSWFMLRIKLLLLLLLTSVGARHKPAIRATLSSPFFQGMATSLSLIVCLYLAYSKLLKLTAAFNASGAWETRDCQRVSGLSLLEVTCRQHSDGMSPIVLIIDTLYTNAALPRIIGLAFVTDDVTKILKNGTYFFIIMDSPGGLPPRDLHF